MAVLTSMLITLLMASGQSTTATEDANFAAAQRAAKENLSTSEGKAYDTTLAQYSSEHHGPLLAACVDAKESTPPSFEVLLKVAINGTISKTLVRPENNVSVCFKEKLKASRLPKPPRQDYWVSVEMSFAP